MAQTAFFGRDLWDKVQLLDQYTQDGMDNLSRTQDFFKKLSQCEAKYSKELQSIAEQYRAETQRKFLSKKKDDKPELIPNSCSKLWDTVLDQTENIARAHNQSSQYIEVELVTSAKNQTKLYDTERKQRFNDIKQLKADLKKVYDNLEKVKKSYEGYCKDADAARAVSEKAKNDMNVTKAYEEKVKEEAAIKSKRATDADDEYQHTLRETNEKQIHFYKHDLPAAINLIQQMEELRVDYVKSVFLKFTNSLSATTIDVAKIVGKIAESVQGVDKIGDSIAFAKHHKSSTPLPPTIPYENYWEKRVDTKRKDDDGLEGLAPEKAYKKVQTKLKECVKELEDAVNKRAGIETLGEVYMSQPEFADSKALIDITNQLEDIEVKIDTCRLRIYKYESFLAVADGKDGPMLPALYADKKPESAAAILKNNVIGNMKGGVSIHSLSHGAEDSKRVTKTLSKFNIFGAKDRAGGNSDDSKAKYRVIYDFVATAENELSCFSGDLLYLTEKTDSGWCGVRDVSGKEGYVPQNYIEEILN